MSYAESPGASPPTREAPHSSSESPAQPLATSPSPPPSAGE